MTDPSGVAGIEATLDGAPFVTESTLPLYRLPLGEHALHVTATDQLGNVSTATVRFTTGTSYADVQALVERFRADDQITLSGAIKLEAKLTVARLLDQLGLERPAIKQLEDVARLANDEHVVRDPEVRAVLIRDSQALIADLNGG